MEINIAHSPDSDDAFMFYALAAGRLDTGPYRFTHTLEDIETLNQEALKGVYEVTAVSIHAYAYLADKYALLSSGASMGEGYGPILVSREPLEADAIRGRRIAVPGPLTSATLALRLFQPDFEPVVIPFDRIMAAVRRGEVDAGLIIHEGQLTYAAAGLSKVLDLGEWWHSATGLPLPLGGNAIRRDLGAQHMREISRLIRESIRYALDHREAALEHAMQYARDLDRAQAGRFVSMYVNERTLDYGREGRQAVRTLLSAAAQNGLIPRSVEVDFIE